MKSLKDINVEFAVPAPQLREFISAYHVFDAGPICEEMRSDAFFPGWANLRFREPNAKLSLSFQEKRIENIPLISVFGPSSNLINCKYDGGRLIGVGLTPIGFSRIFGPCAYKATNSIVEIKELLPKFPMELSQKLHNCEAIGDIAQILDDFVQGLIKKPRHSEQIAKAFWHIINDNHEMPIDEVSQVLGIGEHQLRRISKRYFGFTPKILLRRTRFLKSIVSLINNPNLSGTEIIESDYFDYSHFVKDCYEFFGMSPREFLEIDAPLMKLSFQRRAEILGAHVQSLHRP